MFAWTDQSFLVGVLAVALTASAAPAAKSVAETERIREASRVLETLVATPDSSIPTYVLERADAIVVIPRLVKGGLVVGAEHGAGVMSIREGGSSESAELREDDRRHYRLADRRGGRGPRPGRPQP